MPGVSGFELLLFDLDGTLLTPRREIHPRTHATLTGLMAAGVRVGFATGRSVVSVQSYVEALRPNGPLILFNGAMVWDPGSRAAKVRHTLPLDDARAALRLAERHRIHVNLYIDDTLYIAERTPLSEESERKDGVPHTPVGSLTRFMEGRDTPPTKLLLIEPAGRFEALQRDLEFELRAPVTRVRSEPTYLELLPVGVNKGAALRDVTRHYGLAARSIMAFGDNLNDLELLREAGWGVAMGNCHPDLRAAADVVIDSHDGAAIGDYLDSRFTNDGGRLVPRPAQS